MNMDQDKNFLGEAVTAVAGVTLLVGGIILDEAWLDRHFLPSFVWSHNDYLIVEWIVRGMMLALGIVLTILARRRIGRYLAETPDRAASSALAIVLALGASELALRFIHVRASEEQP